MDGGKVVHPCPDNQQADPKKQKLETSEGMSREERLNLFIASNFKDQTKYHLDDGVDLSGPHPMTMREFASMQLDDIEHGNFDLEVDYSNIDDFGAVLRLYDPEADILRGQGMLPEIMDCSRLAIGEYNKSNGTHFDLVRVLKANVEALSPYQYYITFDAHDATRDFTSSFQALVAIRIPTTERLVLLVQIRKPPEPYCPMKAHEQLRVN